MIALLLACHVPDHILLTDDGRIPLEAPRLARRMSLDLRGVLPTVDELDAVEADPAALDDLRDAWLDDPRLEDRLVDLLAERWHTRVDAFDIRYYDYDLPPEQEHAFERAVGEEPLRLLARVATEDRPWSDALAVDWTLGNDLLASIWPLDCEDGDGWRPCTWTDGRPAAGVLASNGLWWRYSTSSFNMSRSRAAAISRLLVCEDIAARPVSFSATPSLLDEDGTNQAIETEPACVTCHAVIDPLAVTLFGFFPVEQYSVVEMTNYHAERERIGVRDLGVDMAWFGVPIQGVEHLGATIGVDPRFRSCAVETFATGLWRRPADDQDVAALDDLRLGFEDDELRVKPLLRAITDGPRYRVGELDPGATVPDLGERLLPPELVGTALQDVTGFSWTTRGFDVLREDEVGYRVLGGGVNGVNVLAPQSEPGLTWLALHTRLAEASAGHAVQDLGSGLLEGVSSASRPGDPEFDQVVDRLHWQLLAVRPTDADRDEVAALWQQVEAVDGAEEAWQAALTLLFLDPRFLSS